MSNRPTNSEEIRQAFLDYFEENKHTIVASSALPNRENPTLLFTNAGMNQFTDIFLGKVKRPYPRATTAQKVMRVQGKQNDLENVGPSPRHHTMFEMLGNFSFGDYFKKEAIEFAWQFATKVLQLPTERLWVSIYEEDDEAEQLWRKHIAPDRILRFNAKENFWEMGDTGPCGPCSELHYYIGDLDKQTPDGVNYDDEYLEFWNLVFMQFERQPDGSLEPLPNPSVDTGMGLERVTQIMQNVTNNYETDLFIPILNRVQELLGHTNEHRQDWDTLVAYRVIADHGRAATFLVGDGVVPGNVGEGYVLRMIIRRAARFGRSIGFHKPFLAEIAAVIAGKMGNTYPEVRQNLKHIQHVLTKEEEKFNQTLDSALERLDKLLAELKEKGETAIPGETAFTLYATYGLPVEITKDVAGEQGFTVDEDGFQKAKEAHAIASGAGIKGEYESGDNIYSQLLTALIDSGRLPASGVDHDPYSSATMESDILGIIVAEKTVDSATAGTQVGIVTTATPFYIESGGEVSDTGEMTTDNTRVTIHHMFRPLPGLIIHQGEVVTGTLTLGQNVLLQVNDERRHHIRRNHTATHLLHQALRDQLGTHVSQAGSLVAPDRLRFDFTYEKAVSKEDLATIEATVNQAILGNDVVTVQHMGQKEAIGRGAMALFGEKYGDIVRTIQIGVGDEDTRPYSFELCGGLHVSETGEIGSFHFVHEGAVAAGIRRVEAVTGQGAYDFISERLHILNQVTHTLNAPLAELPARLDNLLTEQRTLRKELEDTRRQLLLGQFDDLMKQVQTVGDAQLLTAIIKNTDADGLRGLMDRFRDQMEMGVAVFATVKDDRPILIAGVSDKLVKRGVKAGNIVRAVAKVVGGGGGGKPHLAQAGGKDASKLNEALAIVPSLIKKTLQ